MIDGASLTAVRGQFRRRLVAIGCLHVLVTVVVLFALYTANDPLESAFSDSSVGRTVQNACLLGFLGSLLYFSRKCYIYLITDKMQRLVNALVEKDSPDLVAQALVTQLTGYYLYLATRPLAGLIVGPLIVMFVVAGLLTLGTTSAGNIGVSVAGTFIVYVASFLAGYSSSDLFDYLSRLGSKLIRKIDVD